MTGAIAATALALALCNIGLAGLLATAVGARPFISPMLSGVLLVLGLAAAIGAILLWRRYLQTGR